jgi:hypothetical protein
MLLPSRRKSSGIYDRSKGGATLLQNLRSGGNVASKPESSVIYGSGGNVASKPAQQKSSRIYDRCKGGATLLQNLRSGGNVVSKPEKEQRVLRPEQGRGNVAAESAQRGVMLLPSPRSGKKKQRDLRTEQGRGNVAAEFAQRG